MRVHFLCAAIAIAAAFSSVPAYAESYSVGDVTSAGGTVTGITSGGVTVQYNITKMTYIDSYYYNDNMGASSIAKIVINGTGHSGDSVTRGLVAMPTIDDLSGYSIASVTNSYYCAQYNVATYSSSDWSLRAYALAQGFTEGTGPQNGGQTKSGATIDGASWMTSDGTNAWNGASQTWTGWGGKTNVGGGGSYDSSTYAESTTAMSLGSWTTIDLTSLWNEVSTNGLVLMAYSLTTNVAEDQTQVSPGGWITMEVGTDDWNGSGVPYITVTYAAVPEPGTIALLAAGAIGIGVLRRINKRNPCGKEASIEKN